MTQYKPPVLIDLWFVVSSILVFWDSGFMLLRPRSFPGGNLFWAWSPYELYSKTDYVYGLKAYQMREGFGPAQCKQFSPSRMLAAMTDKVSA